MSRVALPGGLALNAEVSGEGPPLILLHGFTGSAAGWGEFGACLARRWTTIAFDIVGHGASDAPEDIEHYRMEQCAEDLVDAAERLGHPRAAWLGYSMGGRTALSVAAARPDAVSALVLIGGSPGLDCAEERLAHRVADDSLAGRIERDGVETFVDYWQSIPLFATQSALPPDVQGQVRAGRLRNSARGLANSLRGMGAGAQPPLWHALGGIDIPVLLLAGALDPKYVEIGKQMAAQLPRARFASVLGAGHAAQLERPAECAALAGEFLHAITHQPGESQHEPTDPLAAAGQLPGHPVR